MAQRIIVCDDESHITRAVAMKLSKGGFDVQTASDGVAAWEAMQGDVPSLLITDCQMPRMGGLELIRLVRSHPTLRNLPVILLTAKSFELDQEEVAIELLVSEIMPKPFSPRELLDTVRDVLNDAEVTPQ